MALQKLDVYGIKMADLKKAVVALNKTGLLKEEIVMKKVGQSGPALLTAFITAIDSIADDATKDIPEMVADFYEAIPQEVYDDDKDNGVGVDEKRAAETPKKSKKKAKKKATKDTPEEVAPADAPEEAAGPVIESECPTFKTGWDEAEDDCKSCSSEFPDEYNACKDAVTAKAAKKKDTKNKAGKAKGAGTPKAAGKRTCYGHMIGSMAGVIDEMVAAGTTKDAMIKTLEAAPFNRDTAKAAAKIAAHILVLGKDKGITVEENKAGVIKGKEKFTEGQTKENTSTMKEVAEAKAAKAAK